MEAVRPAWILIGDSLLRGGMRRENTGDDSENQQYNDGKVYFSKIQEHKLYMLYTLPVAF